MPWKEQRAMSLKLQFVERAVLKGSNLTELCAEFGVSRQTGHKWLRRYRELGPLGLVEQSRRLDSIPGSTGEDVVLAILELRNQHSSSTRTAPIEQPRSLSCGAWSKRPLTRVRPLPRERRYARRSRCSSSIAGRKQRPASARLRPRSSTRRRAECCCAYSARISASRSSMRR